MDHSRRRVCKAGIAAGSLVLAGCLGDESPSTGTDSPAETDRAEWTFDGTLPIETATQYQGTDCECCDEYAGYLEDHGIDVEIERLTELPALKTDLSVPTEVRSCHTTVVDGYLIEGHVPLEAVEAMFEDGSPLGVAIPGMPQDAPGMGPRGEELQIYSFEADGDSEPFVTV